LEDHFIFLCLFVSREQWRFPFLIFDIHIKLKFLFLEIKFYSSTERKLSFYRERKGNLDRQTNCWVFIEEIRQTVIHESFVQVKQRDKQEEYTSVGLLQFILFVILTIERRRRIYCSLIVRKTTHFSRFRLKETRQTHRHINSWALLSDKDFHRPQYYLTYPGESFWQSDPIGFRSRSDGNFISWRISIGFWVEIRHPGP
jgi:hypothetical protein